MQTHFVYSGEMIQGTLSMPCQAVIPKSTAYNSSVAVWLAKALRDVAEFEVISTANTPKLDTYGVRRWPF